MSNLHEECPVACKLSVVSRNLSVVRIWPRFSPILSVAQRSMKHGEPPPTRPAKRPSCGANC